MLRNHLWNQVKVWVRLSLRHLTHTTPASGRVLRLVCLVFLCVVLASGFLIMWIMSNLQKRVCFVHDANFWWRSWVVLLTERQGDGVRSVSGDSTTAGGWPETTAWLSHTSFTKLTQAGDGGGTANITQRCCGGVTDKHPTPAQPSPTHLHRSSNPHFDLLPAQGWTETNCVINQGVLVAQSPPRSVGFEIQWAMSLRVTTKAAKVSAVVNHPKQTRYHQTHNISVSFVVW